MNKQIFVVYWVDLDDDCLKNSIIKILGVFDNKKDAEHLSDAYDHKGYAEDSRCYYTSIDELELNVIPVHIKHDIDNIYGLNK